MKKLIHSLKTNLFDVIILVIVSILYLLNNCFIKGATVGLPHDFFVCYFNDLMAPMFMLSYSNILLGTIGRRISKLTHIFEFCLVIGSIWEFVAPLMKKGAVWDPFDILCYMLGGIIYWVLPNRKAIIR